MSINFYALRAEGERPINLHESDDTNMSNATAAAVLGAMGVLRGISVFECQLVSVADFRRGLMLALNTERPEGLAEPAYDDARPGQVRVISMGLPAERIRAKLEMLRTWTEAMVERGATLVYWG